MEKPIKIAIVGYKGKMGSCVFGKLNSKFTLVGIDRENKLTGDSVSLVIDFADAESSVASCDWCKNNKVPLIIGSTGQTPEQNEKIREASKIIPIFKAGNFSVGIMALKNALSSLINSSTQDIVVFEKHHKNKKDAPSGTAKEIAEIIWDNFNITPSVIFERGGIEVGTHSVDIYYKNEVLSISHRAFSREAFADGVMLAVDFILSTTCAGLYGMADL